MLMSEEVQRGEAITAVPCRSRWSVAEKVRLVNETLEPEMSVSFVAHKHGLITPQSTAEPCCSGGGAEQHGQLARSKNANRILSPRQPRAYFLRGFWTAAVPGVAGSPPALARLAAFFSSVFGFLGSRLLRF